MNHAEKLLESYLQIFSISGSISLSTVLKPYMLYIELKTGD